MNGLPCPTLNRRGACLLLTAITWKGWSCNETGILCLTSKAPYKGHGRSNCETLFELTRIPSDNHIRTMLDPAEPELLHPVFTAVVDELEDIGGLDSFRRLDGHVLVALDGTQYFCSDKIHCEQCSKRLRSNGKIEYYHAMLGATLVAPGHNHVVPLEPEFIAPQDGAEKQDCESRAARRWLAGHGAHYARLNPVYLGDDLFSNQPMCEAVLAEGSHFLFVCKPSSHPLIQEYISGVNLEEHSIRIKRGREWATHDFRWMNAVPLRNSKDALAVNWFEITIRNPAGEVTYRNSFITDLAVDRDNVAELAACGRARCRVGGDVAIPTPHSAGRADFPHPVPHGRASLTAAYG